MNCANCGTSLPEGAAFCPQCGTRTQIGAAATGAPPPPAQQAPPAGLRCQMCGRDIPANTPYCPKCGARAPVPGQVVGRPAPGYETPPLAGPGQPQYGAPQQQTYGQPQYGQTAGPPYYAPPRYSYAGFWPRFGAWLLDLLFACLLGIIPGALIAFALVAAVESGQDTPGTRVEAQQQDDDVAAAAVGGFLLGFAPVIFFYNWVAGALGGGWGKRIVGLRIKIVMTGEPPGWGSGFIRVIVPVGFGLIPIAGNLVQLVDNLSCIWDSDKQTWHDKAAGTVVVVV